MDDLNVLMKEVEKAKRLEYQTSRVISVILWRFETLLNASTWIYPDPERVIEAQFDPTTAELVGYLRTGENDVRVIHDLVNSAPTNEVAQICIETEIGVGCVVSEEQTEGKVRATEIAKVAGKDNTDKLPYVLSLVGRSLAALPKPLTFINAQVFATSEDTRKAIEYSLNECLEERFKG